MRVRIFLAVTAATLSIAMIATLDIVDLEDHTLLDDSVASGISFAPQKFEHYYGLRIGDQVSSMLGARQGSGGGDPTARFKAIENSLKKQQAEIATLVSDGNYIVDEIQKRSLAEMSYFQLHASSPEMLSNIANIFPSKIEEFSMLPVESKVDHYYGVVKNQIAQLDHLRHDINYAIDTAQTFAVELIPITNVNIPTLPKLSIDTSAPRNYLDMTTEQKLSLIEQTLVQDENYIQSVSPLLARCVDALQQEAVQSAAPV